MKIPHPSDGGGGKWKQEWKVKGSLSLRKLPRTVDSREVELSGAIYALGLPCVLAPPNADQKIGSNAYHYRDPVNRYVVDRWWGQIECARKIMEFENQIKVKMDFGNVWPSP